MTIEEKLASTLKTKVMLDQIKIGRFDINYLTAGSGPPLLLIHGGNIGWGQWHVNIDAFARHFTVYAIDLPGGGRSTRVNFKTLDFEHDLVEVVAQFIEAKKLDSLHIVGTSNGGWVAMKLALKCPSRIKKLVLADSVGFSDYATIPDRIMGHYSLAEFVARTIFKPLRTNPRLETMLRSVFYRKELTLRQEFIDYFYETMETSHNLLFISRLTSAEARKTLYLDQQLSSIMNETLIIWGEQDALMPLKKYSKNFCRLLQAKVKVIAKAGHIPSIEKPEEFNKLVVDFLSSPSIPSPK